VISRHWTGVAKAERAEDYISHLKSDTFPKLAKIDGFVSASVLRREVEDGIEFRVVTQWESWHAITQFAGKDPGAAVVPEIVQAMMERFDQRVVHYEVAFQFSPGRFS
jgi:heme-degrading monooxygenase HmoA